jgi:hypothetical protein
MVKIMFSRIRLVLINVKVMMTFVSNTFFYYWTYSRRSYKIILNFIRNSFKKNEMLEVACTKRHNNHNTMSIKSASTNKSFCKVCCDAGKSEEDYTSHNVKASSGTKYIVVCPTLMSTTCKYCRKKGHTAKFCPILKKKEKEYAKTMARTDYEIKTQRIDDKSVKKDKKKINSFDLLGNEYQDVVKLDLEMPVHDITSYASIVKLMNNVNQTPTTPDCPPPDVTHLPRHQTFPLSHLTTSSSVKPLRWVDMESDDEDEQM